MKKLLLIPILLGFLVLPTMGILAATCGNGICETGETNSNCSQDCPKAPSTDVMTVLDNVINWMFIILLVMAAIFIIMAAFYFVTAAGNPETVSKARNFVLYALIGVLVAFMARGLVALVGRIVG